MFTGFQTSEHQEAYKKLTKQGSLDLDDLKSTILVEQTANFTTSCIGVDQICISRNHCPNGYIHITKNVIHSLSSKVITFHSNCVLHYSKDIPVRTSSSTWIDKYLNIKSEANIN